MDRGIDRVTEAGRPPGRQTTGRIQGHMGCELWAQTEPIPAPVVPRGSYGSPRSPTPPDTLSKQISLKLMKKH